MAGTQRNGRQNKERSVLMDLFGPVDEEKVLIPGESIVYDERRHWATLIQPMLEMLVGLILITSLTGSSGNLGLFGVVVLAAVAGLIYYRVRTKEWNRWGTAGALALLFLSYLVTNRSWFVTAILAILFICTRFLFNIIYWLYYERLYITNRRIVLASAFLGSDISTMPLTRVTDISYRTTVPADILGYGILRVETAGQDQALSEIRFLEKPNEFYNSLIERTTAAVGSVTERNDEDDGSGTLEP